MGGSPSSERRRQQQQQQHAPQRQVPQRNAYPGAAAAAPQHGVPPPQRHQPPPPQQQHHHPNQPPQSTVSEAQTIKNEATVMVETVKFDRDSSCLKFRTNTTVPAEMEIHVAVRIDVMQGQVMITPNKPKAPPPKQVVEIGEHDHEVYVDLANVSQQEQQYLTTYPKQLPIVIAMYYMPTAEADPGNQKEGQSGAMNRCEYTMAQVLPDGKFVKQLLRTRTGVFKIENLFGGEHADVGQVVDPAKDRDKSPQPEAEGGPTAGAVVADDDGDEDGLCVICLTNEKNTAVMPCRHMCLCNECAEELRARGPKCPVCRGPLHQLIKLK